MSQDTYGRYTSGGGRPINEMGGTTPGIEYSESERPAVGLLPAPYLPVARFDEHKRANIVLSAGTPVALDGNGNLVPAGIPGGHAFEYTALDYRTGLPATKSAADGTAISAAGYAAMNSGLTDNKVGYFLRPVGIVSYNVFQFEGGTSGTFPAWTLDYSNPVNYGVHNSMAQDLVAITCDYVINVPYIYTKNLLSAQTKIFDNTANQITVLSDAAKTYPFAHDELIANVTTVAPALSGTSAVVQDMVVSTGTSGSLKGLEIIYVSPACGYGDNGSASDTGVQYLLLASGATGLTLKVGSDGSAGSPITFATLSTRGNYILYDGTTTSKYVVLRNPYGEPVEVGAADNYFRLTLGDQIKPGDWVVCREGKFVKYVGTRHESDERFGQVLRVDKSPAKKDYLDRVKTAYDRSSTVSHRMAGSATRGVPFLLHLVTDGAQVLYDTAKTTLGGSTELTSTGLTTPPLAMVVINMLR